MNDDNTEINLTPEQVAALEAQNPGVTFSGSETTPEETPEVFVGEDTADHVVE